MALDFQQVYTRIKEIGASLPQRKKTLDERRTRARLLFRDHAHRLDELRQKVESAKGVDPSIRCASPVNEPLDASIPAPGLPDEGVLIAADGSQINPDRHSAAQFGLINVGAIILRLNSGEAPRIITESELLFDDELYTPSGSPLSEGMVALRRDLRERSKLDELAAPFSGEGLPVITFTDGPLELWGARDGEDAQAFFEGQNQYKTVLSRLQTRGVVTAGYVDKPSADLVVRLLELMEIGDLSQVDNLRNHRPLRGVSDRWLFGDRAAPLLGPGERSAVFFLQSKAEKDYPGVLGIHFFYLNVGHENHPWPVRVEIPQWVAADAEKLGLLHAVLVSQCRMMGAKPYPYLLHRAHETAVVSFEERRQVQEMLMMEIRRAGAETDDGSYKQAAKDLPGRASRGT